MSNMRKNVVTLKSLLPAPGSATESSVQSGPAGQKELTAEDYTAIKGKLDAGLPTGYSNAM